MSVTERVKTLIVDELSVAPEVVTPDALLEGGYLWGSMDVLEGYMRCEEEFGIDISDEEAEATGNTVEGLIRLVEDKLRDKPLRSGHIK